MGTMLLRVAFAALFGLLGLVAGKEIALRYPHLPGTEVVALEYALPALGLILGVAVSPLVVRVFMRTAGAIEDAIARLAPAEAVSGTIGLLVGLLVSVFVRDVFHSFAQLPRYGPVLSLVTYALITLFCGYVGVRIGVRQRIAWWMKGGARDQEPPPKLLDTSAIVDGRIYEIAQAGFVEGRLLVPRFVLRELQAIADSADPLKRIRGRRGLEVLGRLRDATATSLEICELDAPERDVDGKLVSLARELHARIITNDYNLNRIARLQGVGVLNVNDLANALRPIVSRGEELTVNIVRDGKEQNQGVGYLDDGTMIVVENGRALIGETVDIEVTQVLQTSAGRMIFAKLRNR